MTDLIDRLTAELEIRNLLADLARFADNGDSAGYLDRLSADVVWSMPANPAIGLAASERHGHAEVAAGQAERIAAGHQGPGSDTMHVVTTTSVEVRGNDATAFSYFQYVTSTTTAPILQSVGRYHDELRRTPAGWKLTRRTVTFG
jgi:3-phenylpropionate/cinnamic acid dioxygenase small subunit